MLCRMRIRSLLVPLPRLSIHSFNIFVVLRSVRVGCLWVSMLLVHSVNVLVALRSIWGVWPLRAVDLGVVRFQICHWGEFLWFIKGLLFLVPRNVHHHLQRLVRALSLFFMMRTCSPSRSRKFHFPIEFYVPETWECGHYAKWIVWVLIYNFCNKFRHFWDDIYVIVARKVIVTYCNVNFHWSLDLSFVFCQQISTPLIFCDYPTSTRSCITCFNARFSHVSLSGWWLYSVCCLDF